MKKNVSAVDSILNRTRIDLCSLPQRDQVRVLRCVMKNISSVIEQPEFELFRLSEHLDGCGSLLRLGKGIGMGSYFLKVYENENSHRLNDNLKGTHLKRELLVSRQGTLAFIESTYPVDGDVIQFGDLKKVIVRLVTDSDLVTYIVKRGLSEDLFIRMESILSEALESIDERRQRISDADDFLRGVGIRAQISGFEFN